MAELRDPTKLKKPKRPELIHTPMALQYRQNSADLNGTPQGFNPYEPSDEEADNRQRMFLDIKKEPYEEDHSSVSFLRSFFALLLFASIQHSILALRSFRNRSFL